MASSFRFGSTRDSSRSTSRSHSSKSRCGSAGSSHRPKRGIRRRWWMTPTSPVPPGKSGNSTLLQDASRPLDGKEQAVEGARNSLTARTAFNGADRCGFLGTRRASRARPKARSTCRTAPRSTVTAAGEQPSAVGCPLLAAKGSISPGPRLSSVLPPNQSFTVARRIDRAVVECGRSAWFRYLMSFRPERRNAKIAHSRDAATQLFE